MAKVQSFLIWFPRHARYAVTWWSRDVHGRMIWSTVKVKLYVQLRTSYDLEVEDQNSSYEIFISSETEVKKSKSDSIIVAGIGQILRYILNTLSRKERDPVIKF